MVSKVIVATLTSVHSQSFLRDLGSHSQNKVQQRCVPGLTSGHILQTSAVARQGCPYR